MIRVLSAAGLAVAIAAMTAPLSANAATMTANLGAGETFSDGFTLGSGDRREYNFFVTEDLVISQFAVSGTGPSAREDLADIRFGLMDPPQNRFVNIEAKDGVFAATNFVEGAMFRDGDMFSFFFTDGNEDDVSVTLSFDTEATTTPIPVPGAGVLLLSALAGGAAFARRRRQHA